MKAGAEAAALRMVRPLELIMEAMDCEAEEIREDRIPLIKRIDGIRIALRAEKPLAKPLQQVLREELQEKLVRLAIIDGDLNSLARRRRHLENKLTRLFYEQPGTGDPVVYRSPAERAERSDADGGHG